ncbi:MAG: RagB/SusD family nutrient uptake outer membrane protein [Prevotella sp.]|nr:RagB/SusD family nutrient uptake outer membrane protein [Prevotella sp.]
MKKQHHIINKVKTLALLVAMAPVSTLLFSSCGDFLEIEPRNEIVLEKFWNEKADVDNIVTGCYSALQSDACIRRMMIWGEVRSDNIAAGTNTNNDANLLNILNENITAKNNYTEWVSFYNVINRCNTVIKYAPEVAEIDPGYTQSELQATIAEMVALRSLSYFYLIRSFRDVPFTREAYIDDDQRMDLPATTFENVLDSLIDDLESVKAQAVKRYPTTTPIHQTGRITQDAIYAMLSEMYLWKQDYDRCIEYADLVIESKKKLAKEFQDSRQTSSSSNDENFSRTNGYPLLNNFTTNNRFGEAFGYLFADEYRYAQQEIIFQLVFSDNPIISSMPANAAVNAFYGNQDVAVGLLAPSDYVLEDIAKSSGRTIYEDKNKKLDARLYFNCNSGNTSIAKYVYRDLTINTGSNAQNPAVEYTRKWDVNDNGSNWIIYRLSDIMLLKAEAITQKLRDGSDEDINKFNEPYLAQIFSLVNAVNKRSVCQNVLADTLVAGDYMTKSQMEDLVMRERQRELMFEGKRWYDLVRRARREGRTTVLSQAAMQKVTSGGSLIANKLAKMDAMYWPYYYTELKVNKNLVQNPAFSSGENSSYE